MYIVILVTVETIGWDIAEKPGLVALLAFDFQMHAKQRKACAPVVDPSTLPAFFVMAGFATFTQFFFVNIILLVARNAGSRRFPLEQRLPVARNAFHQIMLTQQLEFRFPVMIEHDRFPGAVHMASLAFPAVFPLMFIDLAMAGHTFQRRSFIAGRVAGMASFAWHFHVLALEGELGLAVIKLGFLPTAFLMAIAAIGAQAALVFVILKMAAITC